jgi:hypothetical protein
VDKNVFRISEKETEQRLTAARPSRILTAFPFDYPQEAKQHIWRPQKKQNFRACSQDIFFSKNNSLTFYQTVQ